ncbi:MAG: M3 family oligoendopeptidase [Clostridiales bacterium]|nr:M3 family oligoendopeptidase [Clostridiales bacterium]
MIKFLEFPYERLDFVDLTERFESHTEKLKNAKTIGEAYKQIIETDYLEKVFVSYATLSEAGNTNNSYDKLYLGEESFFNDIKPKFSLLVQKRNDAILQSNLQVELRKLIGNEFFDSAKMQKRTVTEDVLKLMNEENVLSQEYSTIMSRLFIIENGEKLTMPEINKRGQSEDREIRRKYAILGERAIMSVSEDLDRIYDEMMKIRTEIAHKTGFNSYTDYCLFKYGRTSYGREELNNFAKNVEKYIVPVVSEMVKEQSNRLGYEVMNYDESTLFPGRKIKIEKELLPAFKQIFEKLSPETKVFFDELYEREFFDLELREGKTNGAYSNHMPLCNMPYIFETYNATEGAVETFAHECGHGLNSFLHRGEPAPGVSVQSSDICETHSMSMEYFVWQNIDEIIPKNDVDAYKYRQLKDSLAFIPYGTAVDLFQTTVYDNPGMTPSERLELWKDLEKRFVPWRKYEKGFFYDEGRAWQRQIHVMKWPFYYIDYVLAQVCALQFWVLDEENHDKAWDSYIRLIKDSGQYSFTEIIKRAGLSTPFEDEILPKISKRALEFISGLKV